MQIQQHWCDYSIKTLPCVSWQGQVLLALDRWDSMMISTWDPPPMSEGIFFTLTLPNCVFPFRDHCQVQITTLFQTSSCFFAIVTGALNIPPLSLPSQWPSLEHARDDNIVALLGSWLASVRNFCHHKKVALWELHFESFAVSHICFSKFVGKFSWWWWLDWQHLTGGEWSCTPLLPCVLNFIHKSKILLVDTNGWCLLALPAEAQGDGLHCKTNLFNFVACCHCCGSVIDCLDSDATLIMDSFINMIAIQQIDGSCNWIENSISWWRQLCLQQWWEPPWQQWQCCPWHHLTCLLVIVPLPEAEQLSAIKDTPAAARCMNSWQAWPRSCSGQLLHCGPSLLDDTIVHSDHNEKACASKDVFIILSTHLWEQVSLRTRQTALLSAETTQQAATVAAMVTTVASGVNFCVSLPCSWLTLKRNLGQSMATPPRSGFARIAQRTIASLRLMTHTVIFPVTLAPWWSFAVVVLQCLCKTKMSRMVRQMGPEHSCNAPRFVRENNQLTARLTVEQLLKFAQPSKSNWW